MPSKNLESVYLKCAMPAKIDVATKFVTEEEGKRLIVNPETGRVNKDKTINNTQNFTKGKLQKLKKMTKQ